MAFLVIAAPPAMAGAKPPAPYPKEFAEAQAYGDIIGINKKTGEYCNYSQQVNSGEKGPCRRPDDCQDFPAGTGICEYEDSKKPEDQQKINENELKRWEEKADSKQPGYEEVKKRLTECVKKGEPFQECQRKATDQGSLPAEVGNWIAGKISKLASDALKAAAAAIGESVVWLLKEFAKAFNSFSTIDLKKTGIGPIAGIMWALSALVAAFLLLIQFGKLAVSQQGGPLVTAVTGLAKWALVISVYITATQTALNWSDTLSTALVNYTFDGGGSGDGDATKAMQVQLGKLFAGLVGAGGATATGAALVGGTGVLAQAVGVTIVIGVLCIVAIGALWIEMLMRQAGIMVLVTVMPLVLAGQMADATREWWPKTRNALIALVLMKPVIVICFSIGFSAMAKGDGIYNVLAGLLIFILAAFAWPVLAKFMTFTSNGSGNAAAAGLMGVIGGSVSSAFGGNQPSLAGPGTVGDGSGYTQAVEDDNAATVGNGGASGSFWSKSADALASKMRGSGSFGSQLKGSVGMGFQVAAAGKNMLETAGANTAAHAGLDQGAQGASQVIVPRRLDAQTAAPTTDAAPSQARESEPPPVPAQSPTQETQRPSAIATGATEPPLGDPVPTKLAQLPPAPNSEGS
ncbi:hypothetical protein [Streptomyces mashuensis]|nr:hypothetical protein [Streptomyces mashuensis]